MKDVDLSICYHQMKIFLGELLSPRENFSSILKICGFHTFFLFKMYILLYGYAHNSDRIIMDTYIFFSHSL